MPAKSPAREPGGVFLRDLLPSELSRCNRAALFLQSGFWGNFKAAFGWEARAFEARWEPPYDTEPGSLLALRRRLPFGLSFVYVPWGPLLPAGFPEDKEARTRVLAELAAALRPFFPKDTAFVRFDPPWYSEGAGTPPPGLGKPFVHAAADIQAPDTVLIDLGRSEEDILAGMKSQWRYNRRFTLKKGVVISRPDEAGLEAFYSLLQMTSRRQAIAIHDADYYRTLFSHFRNYERGDGKPVRLHLYLAEHEGEALAAIVVLFWGEQALYLYAASSDRKRNLMPSFALQIQAILDARAAGCLSYDLFGIPPNEDPRHPMAGLYRFKTGFGGQIVHRPGSWDYAYRPAAAALFRAAEALRKRLRDRGKVKSHGGANDAGK